jgi:hypothetical protein
MQRYYFHVYNHDDEMRDNVGVVLANDKEAYSQALETAGQMLKDAAASPITAWRMNIADEFGGTVCKLMFQATQ